MIRPTGFDRRLVASLIALAVVVAACAAAPITSTTDRNLVIWVATPSVGASILQRIGTFMHDNPGIHVTVFDHTGAIKNGDVSIAIEALQTSNVAPDVIALTDRDLGLMSNQADLLDLGPYVIEQSGFQTDDFFPSTLDAFRAHGKQYAIPSEVDPWVVFYNKQLFDKAHVPYPNVSWSASEFLTAAGYIQGTVQTTDRREQQVGFVTNPTQALLPVIQSFGVDPGDGSDDPYAKWLIDHRSVEAGQWLTDLVVRHKVMPFDPEGRETGFWFIGRSGIAAMFMDQREQIPAYFERNRDLTPTVTGTAVPPAGWKFSWDVAMMPKQEVETSIFSISGYGISQTSTHPDDAWLLIDYLTKHLPQQTGSAYVPSRESLAYSPEFAALYPEPGREAYIRSVLEGHRIPIWPPAADPTTQDLTGMLQGTVHPGQAMQAYRDRIQPLINLAPPATPTPIGYVAPPPPAG